MNYKEYIDRAFHTAEHQGFHNAYYPLKHWLMLTITEVSEMVEADRSGKRAQVQSFNREIAKPVPEKMKAEHWKHCFKTFIKDSVEDEMADVCIRLFDLAGLVGAKIPESGNFEMCPEERVDVFTGKTFSCTAFELCKILSYGKMPDLTISYALTFMRSWAKMEGIDLQWHIEHKMQYNEMRGPLHGKRY